MLLFIIAFSDCPLYLSVFTCMVVVCLFSVHYVTFQLFLWANSLFFLQRRQTSGPWASPFVLQSPSPPHHLRTRRPFPLPSSPPRLHHPSFIQATTGVIVRHTGHTLRPTSLTLRRQGRHLLPTGLLTIRTQPLLFPDQSIPSQWQPHHRTGWRRYRLAETAEGQRSTAGTRDPIKKGQHKVLLKVHQTGRLPGRRCTGSIPTTGPQVRRSDTSKKQSVYVKVRATITFLP